MTEITNFLKSYLSLVEFLLAAKQRLYEIGADKNLSGMQVITILMLDEPRPMHYFTKFFNCDPSNVTSIVDGLEDKGLAVRTESQADRRIKLIKLNTRGNKIRQSIIKSLVGDEEFFLNKLTAEEAATFTALVQKISQDRED